MKNIKNKLSNIFKFTFLMLAFSTLSNNNVLNPRMMNTTDGYNRSTKKVSYSKGNEKNNKKFLEKLESNKKDTDESGFTKEEIKKVDDLFNSIVDFYFHGNYLGRLNELISESEKIIPTLNYKHNKKAKKLKNITDDSKQAIKDVCNKLRDIRYEMMMKMKELRNSGFTINSLLNEFQKELKEFITDKEIEEENTKKKVQKKNIKKRNEKIREKELKKLYSFFLILYENAVELIENLTTLIEEPIVRRVIKEDTYKNLKNIINVKKAYLEIYGSFVYVKKGMPAKLTDENFWSYIKLLVEKLALNNESLNRIYNLFEQIKKDNGENYEKRSYENLIYKALKLEQ